MSSLPAKNETLLLKQPTLSTDQIAFLYAGDIWIAERGGARSQRRSARRLSTPRTPTGGSSVTAGSFPGRRIKTSAMPPVPIHSIPW